MDEGGNRPETRTCVIGEADPFIARLLERFAEESGLFVARARAAQEMLDLARTMKPEVILIEAELPGKMRGWEAIRALKTDPELCHIPVISCSWLSEAEARILTGEVAGHLQKPELHYDDFVLALAKARALAGRDSGSVTTVVPSDGSQPGT